MSFTKFPLNFKKFEDLNRITNDVDATLLLSKIKFHHKTSKITSNGKIWLIRSRQQIAAWFNFNEKKVDRILKRLVNLNLIEKKVGLWYGKKAIYINVTSKVKFVPINFSILNTFKDICGNIKESIILSKIIYSYARTKIEVFEKKWCCLTKKSLSDFAQISIRSLDSIIESLKKKGLILKDKFTWNERVKTHYHIPNYVMRILERSKNEFLKSKNGKGRCSHFCQLKQAKKGKTIRIRKNTNEINNKTTSYLHTDKKNKCDINFEKINSCLSTRQSAYLEGAIKKTTFNFNLAISSPKTLFEEMKFSILNNQQRKGITTFTHAVSRCMKILSSKNWQTPFGFCKFSNYGKEQNEKALAKAKQWQKEKVGEGESKDKVMKLTGLCEMKKGTSKEVTEKALESIDSYRLKINLLRKHHENSKIVKYTLESLLKCVNFFIKKGAEKEVVIRYVKNKILLTDK